MTTKLTPEQQGVVLAWPEEYDIPIFPADTKNKRIHFYGWQNMDFTNYDFRAMLAAGNYDNGIAIRTGKTLSGKYAAYSIAIDFDGVDAVEEWFENWESVEALSQKTLIEWHKNKAKIHVILLSNEPVTNRKIQIRDSLLEIRCEYQALFVSPSEHKEGNPYSALGTKDIAIMDSQQIFNLKSKVETLCQGYMSDENKSDYTKWLEDPANYSRLGVGQGRHNALVHLGTAYYYRYKGEWQDLTDSQRKGKLLEWNSKLSVPKPESEVNNVWKWVVDHHHDIREKERNERRTTDDAANKRRELIEEASETIRSRYSFVTLKESDEIYYYQDGRYILGEEIVIRQECQNIFGYSLNISMRTEVREYIKNLTYHNLSEFDSDLNIINMSNGLYDIKSNILNPHTPDYLSMNQIPVVYDRDARPKLFIKFLLEVLYRSEIKTLIELTAYTFHRANPFEIIVILHGEGSNGKGVFFGVLTALHGRHNISNTSLQELTENTFALEGLVGKSCNLDAELSSGTIKNTTVLKKITGNQPIRVEKKYHHAYDARLYAKEWLSANKIPQTDDPTDAYYRRNYVISFPNKFDVDEDLEKGTHKIDPYLTDKLTTQEELSGIFNVLMDSLRCILRNKKISTLDKTIQQRREKYEMSADPIQAFLDMAIDEEAKESDTTTKEVVYAAYLEFCKDFNISGGSKEGFGKAMRKHHKEHSFVKHEGKSYRVWLGIKLTEKYLNRDLVRQAFVKMHKDGLQGSLGS